MDSSQLRYAQEFRYTFLLTYFEENYFPLNSSAFNLLSASKTPSTTRIFKFAKLSVYSIMIIINRTSWYLILKDQLVYMPTTISFSTHDHGGRSYFKNVEILWFRSYVLLCFVISHSSFVNNLFLLKKTYKKNLWVYLRDMQNWSVICQLNGNNLRAWSRYFSVRKGTKDRYFKAM